MKPEAAVATGPAAEPLGILACAGALPLEIADAAAASGRPVHIVGIAGFADPAAVARYSHELASVGQVGRILASFRRAGVREIVIAGAMQRPDLAKVKVDLGFFRHIGTVVRLTRGGDDSVLRGIVRLFEGQGFTVRGVGDVAPHLLAAAGCLGACAPEAEARRAIARATSLIEALGAFDIGQAVVAGPEHILAIEGVRGTDALLGDVAIHLTGRPDLKASVLVKRAKPGQEMRVDLPTVGPRTVSKADAAGLAGIAVGAGETILLERAEMIREADAARIFVQGMPSSAAVVGRPAEAQGAAEDAPLAVLARTAPTPFDRRDVAVARRLLPVLRRHGTGRAVVVAGEHILGIAAAVPADRMVAALGRRSHWGRRVMRSRIGTLVLDLAPLPAEEGSAVDLLSFEVFKAALDAGLAGICCLGAPIPAARRAEIIGWANDGRLFLLGEEGA